MGISLEFFDSSKKLNLLILGIFFAGLFVLALGAGLFYFKNQKSDSDIQIISAENAATKSASAEVTIDVGGAVVNPGVYKLSNDLRVNDVIGAAGGLAVGADTSKMNLAAKIGDGQKIYVPMQGQNSNQAQNGSVAGVNTQISINNATEQELDSLPGVGPVTVKKIIASRPYSSLDELLSKKVVSSSVYEKIKDLISW